MQRKIIRTDNAPEPIGPYSQAIQVKEFIFASGQIAINPASGAVESVAIAEQTRQVLENLKAVLQAAGATTTDVVKTTIFLKDMNDFPVVNEIYATYFHDSPPARSTIQVSRLPKDALIEIECVAWAGKK